MRPLYVKAISFERLYGKLECELRLSSSRRVPQSSSWGERIRGKLQELGANNDVAAVTAFPNLNFALLENLSGFDVLQKGAITLFMVLLDFANHAELGRQSLKPSSSAVLAKSSYISVHS